MKPLIIFLCYFLYPIKYIEKLGPLISPQDTKNCNNTTFAIHRGFSNNGLYEDSSHRAIKAAVAKGIKHIEIDVTLVPGEIFLRHDSFKVENLTANNIKRLYPDIMTLQEFVDIYSKSFQTVLVDIKGLNQPHSEAFNLFKILKGADNFYYIGGSCRLLTLIQKELGWKAGCEAQGIIGNWLLGMSLWSANYAEITNFQIWLNRFFQLKTIFWTFHNSSQAKHYCEYRPDILLVDSLDK
jgi:glycerophosphoryl diester phosphodiesterase